MAHMMVIAMVVLLHFQYHFQQKKLRDGVFTLKNYTMKKKSYFYFGFYRDYSIKNRPVILEVTHNIDSLSCELLGGKYPLLKRHVTKKERNEIADELAVRYNASFIEIGDSARKKVRTNKLFNGEPDTTKKPKGIG
jgi:hypothetical protein